MVEDFGRYLRKIREDRGYTVNQLAMYSEVSSSLISRIENGKRGVPKPETLSKLAKALDITYLSLLKKAGYMDEYEEELMTPLDADKDIAEINEKYKGTVKETPSSYLFEKEPEIPIEELVNHTLTYKGHVLTEEQKQHLAKLLQAAADMLEK